MAFKLISSGGFVQDPAVVNLPASGVIYANSVVVRDVSGAVALVSTAAAAGMLTTNIVGVSLDYVQGASDTFVRVIPFAPGQVWEADTVNVIATTNILVRHTLSDSLRVRNVTNANETASTAIFFCLGITGATTGSGKILGTFLPRTPFRSGNFDILG